jgi:dUTP pyrophosphatase
MFLFQFDEPSLEPEYMSSQSAAADLKSRTDLLIEPGAVAKVPTGIRIVGLDSSSASYRNLNAGAGMDNPVHGSLEGMLIPELQIRARSGLAAKHHISLANGVGTIDADYRDEICVLLVNHGKEPFQVRKGDRIAQMVCQLVIRLPTLPVGGRRLGGFGSTGLSANGLDNHPVITVTRIWTKGSDP